MSLISPKLYVCIISQRNKTFQEYCLLPQRISSFLKLCIDVYLFYLRVLIGGYNWFKNLYCNWLIAHLQTCVWVYQYSKLSISVSICAYGGMVTEIKLLHNKWPAIIVRSALSKRPFIQYSNHYVKCEHETQKDYNHIQFPLG